MILNEIVKYMIFRDFIFPLLVIVVVAIGLGVYIFLDEIKLKKIEKQNRKR
jgi:hypothetical protein